MIKSKFIFISICFLALTSCFHTKIIEGNYLFPNKIETLKVGMTKLQITELFGPYTFISSFDSNIWYYMYEVSTKRVSFANKKILDAKVIVLTFSSNNTVTKIDIISETQRKDIPYNNGYTEDILKKQSINDPYLRKIDSLN